MKNGPAPLTARLHGDRSKNPEEEKDNIFGFF
jgi:hypothetical protein